MGTLVFWPFQHFLFPCLVLTLGVGSALVQIDRIPESIRVDGNYETKKASSENIQMNQY